MTEAQLTEIERLASLMFSTAEINLIAGLDRTLAEYDFAQVEQAMLRGRLRQEAEVRTSIFELAKAGSAPAQTLATQLINQARVAAAGL